MKVITFDTQAGLYHFELDLVEADWHAHPVIEIVIAVQGSFRLQTAAGLYEEVVFAVIDKNIKHRLQASQPTIVLMLEHLDAQQQAYLHQSQVSLAEGVFATQTFANSKKWIEGLLSVDSESDRYAAVDPRVQLCLSFFQHEQLHYPEMMKTLQGRTHLSESRLSHLFKDEMGISLKKYLVWCRLRTAIQLVMVDQINLYEAAIRSGFYDQAHLSKAFKQMLGLSPSKVYNSRMLQG